MFVNKLIQRREKISENKNTPLIFMVKLKMKILSNKKWDQWHLLPHAFPGCPSKCRMILSGGEQGALVCSTCQFPWCKCSHRGWIPAINVMSLNVGDERDLLLLAQRGCHFHPTSLFHSYQKSPYVFAIALPVTYTRPTPTSEQELLEHKGHAPVHLHTFP